ncbi:lysine--tRNA ligase [Candidatus Woesebacteria bacterium RBG_16_36_11]|uniref:Lysine--tRNA ligase n=3 Tax=Candidatus Woeseibacteriota TaxID=1752722 RepID=A0A1F7XA56_9BACT|nr:MAG: lysine--tRNA ligase [Candidatus Woesebacteria bacterium RBG_13_36_22]OGM11268.1 MAG: lysine--tRNA ligase [Candidatus Woesebacteria bacterium RBG_16_36_11]OGM17522.1 MAG: lysine--tRNA ligase [Candidatus Woesebacteria bacterium RBG_19FT_COMBO_37_29]
MHWADKIAKEIISSNKYKPYWVDDMTTPSGYAHIGSIRGPLIHDLIYKALKDFGEKAITTYVFNDFDPIDGLPQELLKDFSKYLGFSLREAPSPVKGYKSFGEYFADDFKKVLVDLGIEAKFLSSYDLYQQGKFDEVIKIALDNAEKIQDIYHNVSGSEKKQKSWLPLQVVCENCGKLGTTLVYAWDGKEVSYRCEPNLVSWAKGCGHEGKVSPYGGRGKLPWKVDWSAHWKVIGVTVEGAGKDHASAGGSYDIAMAICKDVFSYPQPFKLPYEWFIVGGKKMSSSKGVGFKAHDITKIFPTEVARFLFTRTDYREAIDFNPIQTMAIPDLFDEYDRCWQAFNTDSNENLAEAFKLSQIQKIPKKDTNLFLPRFRDVANYIEIGEKDLSKKFTEVKRSNLIKEELEILKQREKYAKYWLENYAPEDFKVEMKEKTPDIKLDQEQKEFLEGVVGLLKVETNEEKLQKDLYELAKSSGIDIKKAFSSIYLVFIGKEYGPRAGHFLLQYPKAKVVERIEEALKI